MSSISSFGMLRTAAFNVGWRCEGPIGHLTKVQLAPAANTANKHRPLIRRDMANEKYCWCTACVWTCPWLSFVCVAGPVEGVEVEKCLNGVFSEFLISSGIFTILDFRCGCVSTISKNTSVVKHGKTDPVFQLDRMISAMKTGSNEFYPFGPRNSWKDTHGQFVDSENPKKHWGVTCVRIQEMIAKRFWEFEPNSWSLNLVAGPIVFHMPQRPQSTLLASSINVDRALKSKKRGQQRPVKWKEGCHWFAVNTRLQGCQTGILLWQSSW